MQYHNLIIDGNNFLFRSFYSKNKKPSRYVNDIDTKPLYQSLIMLKSLAERYSVENIYFTWDKRLNVDFINFRRELVSSYKENRVDTDDKKNILSYMSLIVEFCEALGIRTIFPYDLEADDVIKYIADKSESALIVSSDRDLLQLVNDHVHQLLPTIQSTVTLENFEDFADVPYEAFMFYKAILGDTSDNIAGLHRYGPVKARVLAIQCHSMGDQWDTIDTITAEQKDIIRKNIQIMDLSAALTSRPDEYKHYDEQWEANSHKQFDAEKLLTLFDYHDFKNLSREIGTWKNIFDKTPKEFSWDDILVNITM